LHFITAFCAATAIFSACSLACVVDLIGSLPVTSHTTNGIRDALPIVPFTFRDERVQRFEDLLFTELGNEFL
jgi:hypothetical protein